MNVYFYPWARDPTMHEKAGYVDCVPFSPQGIERWITSVDDPAEAELIYAGQFHDTVSWRLSPGRFEHWEQYPEKHVFDIEGDWRDKEIPDWLRPAVLIAMNARPKHRDWRLMVRPGSSKLLVCLARERQRLSVPVPDMTSRLLWFRGQKDSGGLRVRLLKILSTQPQSQITHDIAFYAHWSAGADLADAVVRDYEGRMASSPFVLAPGGEGWGATLRMYEACYFGCIPIVVSDCQVMEEPGAGFMVRLSPYWADERLLEAFQKTVEMSQSEIEERGNKALIYWNDVVVPYFMDPTAFFIQWLGGRGLKS